MDMAMLERRKVVTLCVEGINVPRQVVPVFFPGGFP